MTCTLRNRFRLAALATIAATLVDVGCGTALADLQIVAFGDSTTAIRSTVPKVYAQILQDELPGRLGEGVTVYNAGIGGNNTYDALGRINAAVVARHPDTVIVQFGINDSWVDSGVQGDPSRVAINLPTQIGHPYASRGNYTFNLESILDTLRGDGSRVILMTPNQIQTTGSGANPVWRNDLLGNYAQVVRNVAVTESVELLDVWQLYSAYAAIPGHSVNDLLVDSEHPNQLGHQLVADGLIAIIAPEPGSVAMLFAASIGGLVFVWRKRSQSVLRRVARSVSTIVIWQTVSMSVGLGAASATPLKETDLFVPGNRNICQYRIPALLTTDKGTLLALCDARVAQHGDAPNNIDIALRRSEDGGRTWGPVHFIVDYPGKEAGSDACVVQDRDTHTIWVFYAYTPEGIGLENAQPGLTGPTTMGYHCVTSDDDGRTWSKPRDITPMVKDKTWNAFWPGPGRGIQTKAGRLVIPSTCWIAGGQPERSSRVIYSDDHGKAWQASAIGGRGTTESQVVELADGSLLLNMRLEPGGIGKGYRAIATSRNGGEAWEPQANETVLVDSTCQASLIRFTLAGQPFGAGVSPARAAGKNRLLFSNPASSMSRSQMTVRLSYDEGKTWPVSKVVYAGPSAYSCLTVLPDGTIGLLYEHGDKDPHEKIGFARFSLEWLTDGKDQLEAK